MKTELFRCIAPPCLFLAALLGAAGASASPIAEKMAGFTCMGKLQIPHEEQEHTLEFSFDAPDRHGAQGSYLIDGRGKASNFYACRQSGDSLSCRYDAGPSSGPLTMRFTSDLAQVKGEFNSPFENSASMHFSARCQKAPQ